MDSPHRTPHKEQLPPQEPEQQCTYNAERVIGNGTFGIVYSAHIVETDETVAIKKVFVDRRYRNRELLLWREMRHPNIVTLKHAFYTSGDSQDELYLNMVMEYVPETVYCVMKRYCKQKQAMPKVLIQLYTYQACRALAHLHVNCIVHRDIKPQNLLVDATKGHLLKLCDFGSAARMGNDRPTLVAYICSRYYRAPELIFGATNYTVAVDLWSMGCVLAEMMRGRPLFPGENGVDQLVEIVKVLGTPTRQEVLAMNKQYHNFSNPEVSARSWSTVFIRGADPAALALLGAFLRYDPDARIRPLEACAHQYFNDLREETTCCPDGSMLPDLFSLTKVEQRICMQSLKERLVPEWYRNSSPSSKVPPATTPAPAPVSPVPVPLQFPMEEAASNAVSDAATR
mmetsp:Transcript_42138/g.96766  ORF Transcript_42138/g.96766 Transcript_42138/m.96766 type:complete len:399 (+) Transcript_42138:56-1252(+)